MNRNTSISIIALSTLIAIGGVSFAVKATQQKKNLQNENKNLREQLANLKRRPQKRAPRRVEKPAEETPAQLVALAGSAETPAEVKAPPKRETFEERMARMKAEDPEGFAERVKRRDEFRAKIKYNLAERTANFMDLNTENMNEKERETHEQLVAQMGTIWDLMEKIDDPDADRREVMGELFRLNREVRPLLEQERSTMFKLMGKDLGYEGDDAAAFAEQIDSIISTTSSHIPMGNSSRGRGLK